MKFIFEWKKYFTSERSVSFYYIDMIALKIKKVEVKQRKTKE